MEVKHTKTTPVPLVGVLWWLFWMSWIFLSSFRRARRFFEWSVHQWCLTTQSLPACGISSALIVN